MAALKNLSPKVARYEIIITSPADSASEIYAKLAPGNCY